MIETWCEHYLTLEEGNLTSLQIQLLKRGPQTMSQAWMMGAMYERYKNLYRQIPGKEIGTTTGRI